MMHAETFKAEVNFFTAILVSIATFLVWDDGKGYILYNSLI